MPMTDSSFPGFLELAKWAHRLMVDEPVETEEAPCDNEDLTDSLKEALREVAAHQCGEIELPDAREFLNSLEDLWTHCLAAETASIIADKACL